MRTYVLPLLSAALLLAGCVDTTGLSPESSRTPHPQSNPGSAVVVMEFADLQCPACRAAHEQIVTPLMEKHGALIRYEFRHFPLRSIHRYALEAAEASECAADQGMFWEFVDLAYTRQEDLSPSALDVWGEELKLDMDLYGRCRDSNIKRDTVLAEYDAGRELGVSGTPTFFVNGKRVDENSLEPLEAAIQEATQGVGQML